MCSFAGHWSWEPQLPPPELPVLPVTGVGGTECGGTPPRSCISGNINVPQEVPGGPQAVPRQSSGVRLGPLTDRVPEYDAFQK